jgi:hypothetical protein
MIKEGMGACIGDGRMYREEPHVIVATYGQHAELSEGALSLVDIACPKLILRDWQRESCVTRLLRLDARWIVYVDEDCFVYDSAALRGLMAYMEENEYACCGVPDGGAIVHRRHNPIACNPFFLVINKQLISSALAGSSLDVIGGWRWRPELAQYVAPFVGQNGIPFDYESQFEPYYGFFYWLWSQGLKILYLNARSWPEEREEITTQVLGISGTPFILHTWYSREFARPRQRAMRAGIAFARALVMLLRREEGSRHRVRILKALKWAREARMQ